LTAVRNDGFTFFSAAEGLCTAKAKKCAARHPPPAPGPANKRPGCAALIKGLPVAIEAAIIKARFN
jgi:hypothetical protein